LQRPHAPELFKSTFKHNQTEIYRGLPLDLTVCHSAVAKLSPFTCMQIYKQLTSPSHALPWEEGRISSRDVEKLGRFRKPIMKLLQREPSQRDTALQFCQSMLEIFKSTPGGTAVQMDTVHW
jgi:hypothetical protein